ncbi:MULTISPECIES: 50S ribosomal protein L25/general stress protein Ctc [Corynebacterium]|uniref:Large ribosomal subunit protein bL25 n=1 Tax=Corynebacterium auriscanis TaxID=99807 RepID=A0A0A2DJS9_9CORY|nr:MULTISPECIES: 50S ribosomal protein L25/general stress protein Ctc [Corynebacterium]KGM18179.1 50S ribosomal protein L25 [Corynebacterium auriscanis]MCX2162346.1 50S ribosomal protein L25/general stress protein Ctc [Corynebacterium auriscanis]OFT88973.1 50S ribosomal protein L25/general stress protein Ctc [Corynebacterium sp. HMSC28B08]WJY73275.1 General stress protein CTC [Corynebacterium auriscanis]
MAELTRLKGEVRTEFGKGASRRLRREFRVPVVVYGNDLDPLHVHVDILELQAILRNEGVNAVIELEVEGQDHLVMIKAVDQNVLTLDVDHADMLNVKRGEKVEVEVPIVVTGESASGSQVMQDADTILVLADVLDIPEEIEVSVEGKEIGDQVLAGDLQIPGNATLVSEEDVLIVNIIEPIEEELPEPGEEGEVSEEEAAEGEAPAGEVNEDDSADASEGKDEE